MKYIVDAFRPQDSQAISIAVRELEQQLFDTRNMVPFHQPLSFLTIHNIAS